MRNKFEANLKQNNSQRELKQIYCDVLGEKN